MVENVWRMWALCKDWESCQMFTKIKKRKRIVKYIRSNAWFERYQADTVELDSRITHNHACPYLLTIVDHFSKYGFAYAIPDKKAETFRNYMTQAFVIGEPQMLHTDNGKEFVNELLINWLEKKEISNIYWEKKIIHKVKEQLKVLTKLFKNS